MRWIREHGPSQDPTQALASDHKLYPSLRHQPCSSDETWGEGKKKIKKKRKAEKRKEEAKEVLLVVDGWIEASLVG
jgi:hypothetical protein